MTWVEVKAGRAGKAMRQYFSSNAQVTAERRAPALRVLSGRDIALRCPRPRSSGRNVLAKLCALGESFRRLTLRSATGTAQRAVPTRLNTYGALRSAPHRHQNPTPGVS